MFDNFVREFEKHTSVVRSSSGLLSGFAKRPGFQAFSVSWSLMSSRNEIEILLPPLTDLPLLPIFPLKLGCFVMD